MKVEADGDLHIALADATGDKPGIVVVEVPAKPQWCTIRETVFSWTRTRLLNKMPGIQAWWRIRLHSFNEEFAKHVDQIQQRGTRPTLHHEPDAHQ